MITPNEQNLATANQQWRDAGRPGSFAEWIALQKEQGTFIKNDTLTKIVDEAKTNTGVILRTSQDNSKVFGVSKKVIVASLVIISIACAIKYYRK